VTPTSPIRRARSAALVLLSVMLTSGCLPDAGGKGAAGTDPAKATEPNSAPAGNARARGHLVELATVRRGTLSLSRVYTGSLRARRVHRVHAQEVGSITALPAYEGDRVRTGSVILRLDRVLLETELAKAMAVRKEAQANLARLERLVRSRMVAEDEVSRGRTAVDVATAEEALLRTRLGYTVVTAPFDGVVTQRLAEPGDVVERHDHVLTLADPSSLIADLEVSELILPHVTLGDRVGVRIDALGDQRLQGRVLRIHPTLDAATRLGRVEVELTPAPDGARAGQFARVSFEVRALDRQMVPFSALRRDTVGEYVFRLREDGHVERLAVRGGRRLAERVEILEGLSDGDQVVTKGFLGLVSGARVSPVAGAAERDDAPPGAREGTPG
jgi:membrane fusion protein (multidrug efflux system)